MATKRQPKRKTPSRSELLHLGSLITYQDGEQERCLGDLMDFKEHGVFDPHFGKVDVTPEEALAHNKALDEALIRGLDESCQVGQGGYAYFSQGEVKTFSGAVYSADVTKNGNIVTFRRNGKTFRGQLDQNGENFNFRRIS